MRLLSNFAEWISDHFIHVICGYFLAILGYFFEIKSAVNVMLIAILFDFILGLTNSVIRRKEKFSMEKFSLAILRALIVTSFVALLFAIDKETHQTFAASYYIACWIISVSYAWSALKNADHLFKNKIFKVLRKTVEIKVKDETGVDLSKTDM